MKITETRIKDVYVIDIEPRSDSRGSFSRVFCKEELKQAGVDYSLVQINRSNTVKKGMIRGLHMQLAPHSEDKIVQCLRGRISDVAVDMRKDSSTYLQWVGVELSAENMKMILIPKGFAHGFQSLEDDCLVEYFVSEYYTPNSEQGYRWNDPIFNINWPIESAEVSEKDAQWPLLKK